MHTDAYDMVLRGRWPVPPPGRGFPCPFSTSTVGVDEKGVPCMVITGKETPETVASKKRQREKEAGYAQKPKDRNSKQEAGRRS